MKIQVTQEDINKGLRGVPDSCHVALAVKKALNTAKVEVGDGFISWNHWSTKTNWNKGKIEIVEMFVRAFDKGYDVTPFEFELEPFYPCAT